MARRKQKPDNYLSARLMGGGMMAVVLIVFGYVMGNMFGHKESNSTTPEPNPQIVKAQPSAVAKAPQRAPVASKPHRPGQPKYTFYNELQRRTDEVKAEAATTKPAATKGDKTANKAEKKPRTPVIKNANYRIQVGAFKDKAQAEQMRKKEILSGLPVEVTYGENKHYLSSLAPTPARTKRSASRKNWKAKTCRPCSKPSTTRLNHKGM